MRSSPQTVSHQSENEIDARVMPAGTWNVPFTVVQASVTLAMRGILSGSDFAWSSSPSSRQT